MCMRVCITDGVPQLVIKQLLCFENILNKLSGVLHGFQARSFQRTLCYSRRLRVLHEAIHCQHLAKLAGDLQATPESGDKSIHTQEIAW